MAKDKESAEKKTARGTRAVKDKWRSKIWYKVRAPPLFHGADLGETPANEPETLVGRVLDVTLNEVSGSGDPTTSHVKLKFRITSIEEGHIAMTKFIGHELTSDYIRRLARRKRSKIDISFPVTTKDGIVFTVKPVAVSEHRLQTRLRAMLRHKLQSLLEEEAAKRTGSEMVRDMLNGEIVKAVTNGLRLLYPLKKIDIRTSIVEGEISDAIPSSTEESTAPPAAQPPTEAPAPEVALPEATV